MKKERADVLLVSRGLAETRELAKRLIMAGLVRLGDTTLDKAGEKVSVDAALSVTGPVHPYASRGGLKLQRALEVFGVSLSDRVVLDVGASTGGFTDCALQHGAALVYSVDVGYGQLAWKLRTDPRVRVMERMNFRHAEVDVFDPRPDAAVMDVSFISISKLLPKLGQILLPGSVLVSLIKPQFEAGPKAVGKGGIVRDPETHARVLEQVLTQVAAAGFAIHGLTHSPIRGGEGNIEFLLWASAPSEGTESVSAVTQVDIAATVATAHGQLQ